MIVISIVLLVLLGVVEIYVRSDAFARLIRPYVAEPLKAALGEGAEIGRIKANFIPLYLEVRDVSIPDAQGKRIIAVRKVKVYINPLPLLLKKIRLYSITILEPRITVKRTKDGVVDLIPFVEVGNPLNKALQVGLEVDMGQVLRLIEFFVDQGH